MNSKQQWEAAARVIEKIEQAGFEAVIVGGAVRDHYLKKEMHDVDVATSALPEEVKAIFHQTIDVGIEHGTVLVVDEAEPIEVTTYRTESEYQDHRRPDEVVFVRSLADDLKRRDFTMNAMALKKDFTIIDYYGGMQDIDAKLIRSVGDANSRFSEDALRMLRAIRFSAQLGFTIEQETFQAIKKNAKTITYIAVERIVMELNKLFVGKYAPNGLQLLEKSNLAEYLPGTWYADDWRLFQADDADIGWAYFNYLNRNIEPTLLNAYKCSNKTKQFAKQVSQAITDLNLEWTELQSFSYEWQVIETAYACLTWQGATVRYTIEQLQTQKQQLVIQTKDELAVNGHDFIQWTDRKRGPWLKEALAQALELVLTKQLENDKQQLKEWFLHDFDNEG